LLDAAGRRWYKGDGSLKKVPVLRRRRTGCAGDSARYTNLPVNPARLAEPRLHHLGNSERKASHGDMRGKAGEMRAGTEFSIEKSVSAKRTQLKNVEVLWNEWVRKKTSWVRFKKRGKKR
jgi:hypothetical protein